MPNDTAHNLIVQHRIGLERYGVALNKKILSKLNKVEADIVAKIAAMPALEAGTFGPSSAARQHLEATLAQIRASAVEAMAVVNSTIETELGDLAIHEVEFAANAYKASLPFQTNFVTPAPQLLKAIVTTRPLQGRFIKDWLATYPDAIKQKVHDAVLTGVMEGESISQIVGRIRGTRALNYGDAVLKGTKRGVEALARTAVNHVSNAAHKAFLDDNADVFDRYQWIAVLDARTTPICRSRSGAVYANSANTANPIPPAHVNCRSTIAPIVIGENVPKVNDYAKWLGEQPTDVQKEVLGPTKLKLWKDGRMTIDKFVTDAGRPLTLDQLKAQDARAWTKAFGSKTPTQAALDPGAPLRNTPPAPVQEIAAQTTAKTKAALKASVGDSAAMLAIKKAAEAEAADLLALQNLIKQQEEAAKLAARAEAAKVLALENAFKAAKEAAQAKKNNALLTLDISSDSNQTVALAQPASSSTNTMLAKQVGGNSAEIIKATGEIADVALDQIEIVFPGNVSTAGVKKIVEAFDPSKPVFATKIEGKFHVIEGKSVVKAAEALGEKTIKVQFLDATEALAKQKAAQEAAAQKYAIDNAAAIEAAAKQAAAKKIADAAAAKNAKAVTASQKAARLKLTDQEIMTVKHEVAQAKDGKVFYKFKTGDDEYHSWAARYYHDVTSPQAETLDRYKGSTYQQINGMLRHHKGSRKSIKAAGGTTARQIAQMDAAFEVNTAPVNLQAFRGFDIRHALKEHGMIDANAVRLPAGFKPEDLIGKSLDDDGFMSFSVREAAAGKFAAGKAMMTSIGSKNEHFAFVMEHVIKKGTPALRGTNYEQEIILKGRRYRVTGVREETTLYRQVTGHHDYRTFVLEVEESE